jgi:hypothetical protein
MTTACENGFPQSVSKANVSEVFGIYSPPSSPSKTVHHSHVPLEGILEVQISQNIRREVLILIFWKEVDKKG